MISINPVEAPWLSDVVVAMFAELPAPGTEWPAERRAAWLRAMNAVLDLAYESDVPPVEITVARGPCQMKGSKNDRDK